MEILSVTLKNFKSHSDRHFVFQPGTNAICGENGAGKTSILEAIAWVLFDYTGDYTKDDLIRNGAASTQVQVTFVSNRDGRTYEIQRCTTKSYTIYDPQLNERLPYSRIREEVLPWLRQHLGVAAGTDLGKLFASTIGVPQGTFTADFLLTRESRKPIFDKILKVEEYQQTWKKLGDLEKYAKHQVEGLETEIRRYTDDLQELATLQHRRQEQQSEIEQVQTTLTHLETKLAELQTDQEQLTDQATQLQQYNAQLERDTGRLQDQQTSIEGLKTTLQQAENAAAICTANREAYQAFLQAEEQEQTLQKQWQIEQRLQKDKRQQERQLSDRQTQLATLTHQLDRLTAAQAEITRLEPLVQEQINLEQAQQSLNQQLQQLASWQQALKNQEKLLTKLQGDRTRLEQEVNRIRTLETVVQQIPQLEQQQHRLQQQLSRIAAATQFEADLRQLVDQSQAVNARYLAEVQQAEVALQNLQEAVPLWAETLTAILTTLQQGGNWQTQLMAALQAILADLTEQTSTTKLEQQLQQVQSQLQTARQQQVQFANLERLLNQQQELDADLQQQQASLTQLHTQLATVPSLQTQLAELTTALQALDDPRGRSRLWQQELKQQPQLQAKLTAIQAEVTEKQQAIAQLDQQLAEFTNLAEQIQAQQAIKTQHRELYQEYLAYRELANTRRERQQQVQDAMTQWQDLQQQVQDVTEKRDRLLQTFDLTHFQTVQTAYQQTKEQVITLTAKLPGEQRILAELDQQLARLATVQTKQAEAEAKLAKTRKVEKFIKFARKAYKEAGPRITERYVQNISKEADRLFRELLNRPNVGLQWTRDYEIIVYEGSHTRRFVNLSGGEQMCAALAVRLALLKVLADIDIAFFDEPTTNMDRPRRESLAEAIANIKTFRQLFVISHDDTFEKITENIIVVERE